MKNPAFQWYPKDCDTDEKVRAMSDRELGFYIRCLNHEWINGSLPANSRELALIFSKTMRDVKTVWRRVSKCFIPHPTIKGRLINQRLEDQRDTQRRYSESRRENAEKRWDGSASISNAYASKVQEHMHCRESAQYKESEDEVRASTENQKPLVQQGSVQASVAAARNGYDSQPGWERFRGPAGYPCIPDVDAACRAWVSMMESAETEAEMWDGLEEQKKSQRAADGVWWNGDNYLLRRLWRGKLPPAKEKPPDVAQQIREWGAKTGAKT